MLAVLKGNIMKSVSVCSVSTDRTVLHIANNLSRAGWGGMLASTLEGLYGGRSWLGGAGLGASLSNGPCNPCIPTREIEKKDR